MKRMMYLKSIVHHTRKHSGRHIGKENCQTSVITASMDMGLCAAKEPDINKI